MPPETIFSGRRVLLLSCLQPSMAGILRLAALALAPGGFDIIDITLLALSRSRCPGW